uniref:Uncharacterized protein n=1 Tax=Anguilla anguilla TaxID=7936 RepID=A0A0E9S5E4_ANGAN
MISDETHISLTVASLGLVSPSAGEGVLINRGSV